jgi:hypothetical protein
MDLQMALVEVVSTFIFAGATVLFAIQAGRSMHEIIHYRVVIQWSGNPQIKFQSEIIPILVRYDDQQLPKHGNQLAALAPTLTYSPLLLYFLATIGIPRLPITKMYILHLGFLLAILVAAWPTFGDIRAFRNAT